MPISLDIAKTYDQTNGENVDLMQSACIRDPAQRCDNHKGYHIQAGTLK